MTGRCHQFLPSSLCRRLRLLSSDELLLSTRISLFLIGLLVPPSDAFSEIGGVDDHPWFSTAFGFGTKYAYRVILPFKALPRIVSTLSAGISIRRPLSALKQTIQRLSSLFKIRVTFRFDSQRARNAV